MNETAKSRYPEVYARWKSDPIGFWGEAARAIDWFRAPATVLDARAGVYGRWYPDGVCNTCHNAVDRHVAAGHGERLAIIHDSPVTGTIRKLTYAELKSEVETLAAVIRDFGVKAGDRVLIYMPMVPETLIAMLACARIGAVHSVVFGGFAARELATRIDDCRPHLVLAASCGVEPGRIVPYKPLVDEAIRIASAKPAACLILQRPQCEAGMIAGRDHDWASSDRQGQGGRQRRALPAGPRDRPALCALHLRHHRKAQGRGPRQWRAHGRRFSWSMSNLYGVEAGDTYWAASDVGWVVGHSYIVYAPLIAGCTSVVYEGKPVGTPDAGAFWRVIADHKVRSFFTAPTAFRAIKKEDPRAKHLERYDVSCLSALFLAGERADPDTVAWAERILKKPVIDHWWQTETGWCIAGNPLGLGLLPVKHGSPTVAMPGYELRVVDEAARPVPAKDDGLDRGQAAAAARRLPDAVAGR